MFLDRQLDPQEFETAALPHLNDLYRTAYRLIGNKNDAEDVVQETYLQAWKSFHRFEPGTNCRAWMFKILFHRVCHHRRRWFGARRVTQSEEISEETLAYLPPVSDHLTDEDVLSALAKLPATFRDVVLLVDVQEFSYKETAEILGIPAGTVMSRLSRARDILRRDLAGFARSHGITGISEDAPISANQKGQFLHQP